MVGLRLEDSINQTIWANHKTIGAAWKLSLNLLEVSPKTVLAFMIFL